MPILWKAIIVIASTAVVAGTTVGVVVYQTRYAREVNLEVSIPEKATIGIPFNLGVNASNISKEDLKDLRISVLLPDGMAFVGLPDSQKTDVRELKNLGAGSASRQNFKIIALGGPNTFKQIIATVGRLPGFSSPSFEKKTTATMNIGGYAIGLDLIAPQKVFNGTSFDAEVSLKNLSDVDFTGLQLGLGYPATFNFIKSTLAPDVAKNTWIFEGLPKGSEKRFKVTGKLVGQEGASFDMQVVLESVIAGQLYQINSNAAAISIANSPISLRIIRGGEDKPVQPGERLSYTLSYINNSDVALRDVVIQAKLTGAMFDLTSINTEGAFRSSDGTVSWNASNVSSLQNVFPGQSGYVTFDVPVKNVYPVKKPSDKNFTVKVAATIDSPTVPYFIEGGRTVAFANIESKVQGRVAFDARGYFRDPKSGISNKGSMPLRLDQPTNFTIHWVITNYATDISDIEVRAFLGGNVRFTGKVKSNAATLPTYNERTQEMAWSLPNIAANTGILGKPIEAIFQIEALPSINDLNRDMLLIQNSALSATDDFTGVSLSYTDAGITTQLPDDLALAGRGAVQLQAPAQQLQQQQQTEKQKLLMLLQQQNASQQTQDEQLGNLQQQQQYDWQKMQNQLQQQYAALLNQQQIDLSNDEIAVSHNADATQACMQSALNKRDAETSDVDENRGDDLRTAAERRRALLVAAALIGDPHLRHIAIVAAIVGYQESEKEIQKSWNDGRAKASLVYQLDVALCNSSGTFGQ
ncbi:MAG: hypothetical protein Q8L24_01730 [bacterium]|nr:hypothetical protein [bacterium]